MEKTSNIKDSLSTICGVLIAVGGGVLVVGQTVALPSWLTAAAGSVMAICTAIIGYLTGKTPSADKKSEDQVVEQNEK